mmetsp:Transcript_20495/g.42991  ORF Transcript_20495/g.42991 Transcript_20495/m.42991 type:complete len:104 (-) Transcript_20495:217-528(-)
MLPPIHLKGRILCYVQWAGSKVKVTKGRPATTQSINQLEREDVVLLVAQSLQVGRASPLQHDWWSAHQAVYIISLGVQYLRKEILSNKSSGVSTGLPSLWRSI